MIDKMKSEFISIAAHQLRTPLSAIKWAIKMVLDGDAGALNEEQQAILSKGYISNERVINLINDMLNVSRIEEGNFGYRFEQANFMVLVSLVTDNLQSLLREKQIKLKVESSHKVIAIDIDEEKMYMALESLLTNAIKYSPPNSEVKLVLEKGSNMLVIRVKDRGLGIPVADQSKIFTKFYRAQNALKVETDGSGLGLFITKNIIEKHGGDITFTSEEGKGTEFVCTLPLKNS
jgi:signal transduction histidine kinase